MQLRRALQLLALAALACCAGPARARWIAAEVGGITVYSEISKDDTRALLNDMHTMRESLRCIHPRIAQSMDLDLSHPLHLFFVKNFDTYKDLLPLYKGGYKPAGGINSPGPLYDTVWVDARRPLPYVRKIFLHEMIHETLRDADWLPLAVNEGLADLYGGSLIKNGKLFVGVPELERMYQLTALNLLPSGKLITVGHGSPDYNHLERIGGFYDESWLLMQWVVCGPDAEASDHFWNIMGAARSGISGDALAAFADGELPNLPDRLVDYLTNGTFKYKTFEIKDLPPAPEVVFRHLSRAEIESALAGAQVAVDRTDEGRKKLEKLSRRYEDTPFPWQELAQLELVQGHAESARAAATKAVASGAAEAFGKRVESILSPP